MPPAAAQRPAGRRIRAELVRRGAVQAVIALPAGLMPPTGIGLHLWVLQQPQEPSAGRLLFVDASADRSSLVETVTDAWRAFVSGRDPQERPGLYRVVPAIDVFDDQVDLSPGHYLPQLSSITPDPATAQRRIAAFADLVDQLRARIPSVLADKEASPAVEAEIGALVKSGTMSLHTPESPRGRQPQPSSSERIQADDILISTHGSDVISRVAEPQEIGSEPPAGTQILRVSSEHYDPWFTAGMLRRADNLQRAKRSSGSGGSRLRVEARRLAIPVLPLQQQRMYGEAFRELAVFRSTVEQVAATGSSLADELTIALTLGVLGR